MISLDISSPTYAPNGRQMTFVESPSQRVARAEFVKQMDADKRVAAWVSGQRAQSMSIWAPLGILSTSKPAAPKPMGVPTRRSRHREPLILDPHMSPIQEDPISNSLCYSVPYIHPEDEEPFILYSTSPAKAYHQQYTLNNYVEEQEEEVIYSTPLPTPSVAKPKARHGHRRHRSPLMGGRLSGLDAIPEEVTVEG